MNTGRGEPSRWFYTPPLTKCALFYVGEGIRALCPDVTCQTLSFSSISKDTSPKVLVHDLFLENLLVDDVLLGSFESIQ